jgi:molybdopterin-binding protein
MQIAARDVSISTSMPLNTSTQNLIVCRVLNIDNGREPSHALVALGCGTTRLYALVAHKAVQALGLSVEQTVWAQFKSVGLLA